jgi:hypothetical protein
MLRDTGLAEPDDRAAERIARRVRNVVEQPAQAPPRKIRLPVWPVLAPAAAALCLMLIVLHLAPQAEQTMPPNELLAQLELVADQLPELEKQWSEPVQPPIWDQLSDIGDFEETLTARAISELDQDEEYRQGYFLGPGGEPAEEWFDRLPESVCEQLLDELIEAG